METGTLRASIRCRKRAVGFGAKLTFPGPEGERPELGPFYGDTRLQATGFAKNFAQQQTAGQGATVEFV